jgi:hypothetical protein
VTIEHADQPAQLPGYGQTMRLVQGVSGVGMFRPAFSKLEIMTVAAALDFLDPKLGKALARKDKDAAMEALREIVLGFAVMCVFADRENTAYIEEMAERAAARREGAQIEQEIEEHETKPVEPIDW